MHSLTNGGRQMQTFDVNNGGRIVPFADYTNPSPSNTYTPTGPAIHERNLNRPSETAIYHNRRQLVTPQLGQENMPPKPKSSMSRDELLAYISKLEKSNNNRHKQINQQEAQINAHSEKITQLQSELDTSKKAKAGGKVNKTNIAQGQDKVVSNSFRPGLLKHFLVVCACIFWWFVLLFLVVRTVIFGQFD